MHVGLERFEFFLLLHAKAMLFIHNDQPQIFKPDGAAQQGVGAHDNVHGAVFQGLFGGVRIAGGNETGQVAQCQGQFRETLRKGFCMLPRQQGGGDDDGHLHTTARRHEGGPHGDLGFAKAHIPAQQTVHGTAFGQIL